MHNPSRILHCYYHFIFGRVDFKFSIGLSNRINKVDHDVECEPYVVLCIWQLVNDSNIDNINSSLG